MRVLWVTNVEINSIAQAYGETMVYGGWLEQTAALLSNENDVQLYYACNSTREYFDKSIDGISFFSFSDSDTDSIRKKRIEQILNYVNPDVIHIWGTEYIHTLDYVNLSKASGRLKKVVVSIQGLVSIYTIHYFADIPNKVIHHRTLKEFVRPNIYKSMLNMKRNGINEITVLESVENCIGRTDWDHACVKQINPEINYYSVNEILREPFYLASSWSYEKCERYTLFFSQANYPLKGFHYMIKALPIIKKKYPGVVLKVLGNDPFEKSINHYLRRGSYEKYVVDLITQLDLKDNVKWLGRLNAEGMIEQYLKANAFVCSSSIENSSNSIGEAMLLGVPVIASDVGGIKSLMVHEQEGILFQGNAYYMIADAVIRVFDDGQYASELGKNARKKAQITHNREVNMRELISVYKEVVKTQLYVDRHEE